MSILQKPEILNDIADIRSDLIDNITLSSSIKGTTQSMIYNGDGSVQKIQHKNSSNVIIREDVFTYENNLITEVRTLSSGVATTFKYHLDTLITEVI